jgi:anti-sigma28 factor (negative regulator of flagellin synthesis)
MDIPGSFKPVDPSTYDTRLAASQGGTIQSGATTPPARLPTAAPVAPGAGPLADSADTSTSPEQIARYVQLAAAYRPASSQRVEDLKAKVRDGSYTADPDELATGLSALFGGPPSPAAG